MLSELTGPLLTGTGAYRVNSVVSQNDVLKPR